MNKNTQILVGVVVLAGLGGLAYMQYNKDKAIGSSTVTSADLPDVKVGDDVDKVSITNGEKGEVVGIAGTDE